MIQREDVNGGALVCRTHLVARYPKHGPRGLISLPRRNASYNVRTPFEPRDGDANGSCDRRMFPRPPEG
jgi:hypothetical protein